IVETTPYLADNLHHEAILFAREGFAFLAVDCRGRGGSGGEFVQWVHDAPDGHDTVQWIAAQPWSDGQVGLGGGSYTGWNQWMIAATRPPALKTIVPSAAFMPGVCIPRGGIGSPYQYRWRVTLKGHSISWNLAADTLLFNRIQGELYARHRHYLEVPGLLGFDAPGWEDDLVNTAWGPRWEARRPSEESLAALDIPVLSLTGTYDTTAVGALEHHRRLDRLGSADTRRNNHLVIGPWDHRGMDGTDQVYGLKFGPAAKVDVPKLRIEWYRWAFGGGEKPAFLDARVKYYVAGPEDWRGADSLDEASRGQRSWFLASHGSATDVFRSGWMQPEPADTPADAFLSDPQDLRPLETETRLSNSPELLSGGGAVFPRAYNSLFFIMGGEDPTNGVFCHNTHGQGVIYHTPALDAPVTIVGEPELELWLCCDAPDADLAVLLYEVIEDGSVIFLSSSQLRLRHRESVESLMPAGEAVRLRFPRFRFVSRRIDRNSRLRLVVRATACAFLQKNLNAATPVHLQQPEEARVARIEVLHDREHPSLLRLPLGEES
ncbi:MAG: CocE/NonD family hydrolase, partial [Gammaproteobacteria bacterium]